MWMWRLFHRTLAHFERSSCCFVAGREEQNMREQGIGDRGVGRVPESSGQVDEWALLSPLALNLYQVWVHIVFLEKWVSGLIFLANSCSYLIDSVTRKNVQCIQGAQLTVAPRAVYVLLYEPWASTCQLKLSTVHTVRRRVAGLSRLGDGDFRRGKVQNLSRKPPKTHQRLQKKKCLDFWKIWGIAPRLRAWLYVHVSLTRILRVCVCKKICCVLSHWAMTHGPWVTNGESRLGKLTGHIDSIVNAKGILRGYDNRSSCSYNIAAADIIQRRYDMLMVTVRATLPVAML